VVAAAHSRAVGRAAAWLLHRTTCRREHNSEVLSFNTAAAGTRGRRPTAWCAAIVAALARAKASATLSTSRPVSARPSRSTGSRSTSLWGSGTRSRRRSRKGRPGTDRSRARTPRAPDRGLQQRGCRQLQRPDECLFRRAGLQDEQSLRCLPRRDVIGREGRARERLPADQYHRSDCRRALHVFEVGRAAPSPSPLGLLPGEAFRPPADGRQVKLIDP
jgi:hypothetical protein